MRKPEQRLWDNMRNALGGKFYLERHENAVGFGRPDVDVMYRGVTLPVELKARENYPARTTTPILGSAHGLNLNQRNWWLTWYRCGGCGYIIIRVEHDLYCVPASVTEVVNELTESELKDYQADWKTIAGQITLTAKRICIRNQ